ncbi:DNA-directed RNA polymerase subunit delta [Desertibacillus haloalkaliphilus]|uniref:DNA-directed RNA polymerase subunit delta n=1 Tax=Desertibacillus haloalkaliphilus TaxID=1328930 RepID=UPI001FEAE1BA|nr:DNA-directed RNA polymerase subunit delta [Desertibacillus haloalkaliphilus]
MKTFSKEEIEEMSMIEVAYEVMKEDQKAFVFNDLIKRIAEEKDVSIEEVNERISHLYTELNTDGRFVMAGENTWGLKNWYALEQIEEELNTPAKPRKKPKKKRKEEDVVEEGFDDELEDEFEDLEDELDQLSHAEDNDEEFEGSDLEEDDDELDK